MSQRVRLAASLLALASLAAAGCGDVVPATPDGGVEPTVDAAIEPVVDAAPPPDAVPTFDLRMFVQTGNHYDFDITPAQSALMDQGSWGGGDPLNPTFADALTVTLRNGTSQTYGKLGLRTVGQSTFQDWARKPNLRIDSNEFDLDLKIGNVEHFRFNNGRVGGLFRESLALRIFDALGYPTPATNHAWVSAPNQWDAAHGAGYERPYEIIEVYKEPWCDRELDGGCVNMWEGVSALSYIAQDPASCQVSTCDNTRLTLAGQLTENTPAGPGYMAATASVIDWPAFHSFQCLAWIVGTGDDMIHNSNNFLVVERDTGLMQFYPYSSDISAGIQVWGGGYQNVNLDGWSSIPYGCSQDPACRTQLLERCDELLDAYDALDPAATIVQPLIDLLDEQGMMDVDAYPDDGFLFWDHPPPTDAEDAAYILDWYQNRSTLLRADPVWN